MPAHRKERPLTQANRVSSFGGSIVVLLTALFLTACAEINHLRDAQSTFSETAVLENGLNLGRVGADKEGTDAAALQTQIRSGYSSVLLSLEEAEDDQAKALKENRLYGNMLMLKAMTHWRLGNLDNALAVAQEAAALSDEEIFPRDKALALAMEGLVRNSQAYALIKQVPEEKPDGVSVQDYRALKKSALAESEGLLRNALTVYDGALHTTSDKHTVQIYLYKAKLAAYQNLLYAGSTLDDNLQPNLADSKDIQDSLSSMQKVICADAKVNQGDAMPSGSFSRLVSWAILLGESVPSNACP